MKLIVSFSIPVLFVILTGIITYQYAEKIIISNYKTTCLQAIEMTANYLELGFDSAKDTAIQYISETQFDTFVSEKSNADDFLVSKQKATLKSVLVTKSTTDDFIENITIMTENSGVITTSSKWEDDLYLKYIEKYETQEEDTKSSRWVGRMDLLDENCGGIVKKSVVV